MSDQIILLILLILTSWAGHSTHKPCLKQGWQRCLLYLLLHQPLSFLAVEDFNTFLFCSRRTVHCCSRRNPWLWAGSQTSWQTGMERPVSAQYQAGKRRIPCWERPCCSHQIKRGGNRKQSFAVVGRAVAVVCREIWGGCIQSAKSLCLCNAVSVGSVHPLQ